MDRPLFAAPGLFAAPAAAPARGTGVRVWLAAAVALVVGIGIGFSSGYDAGRRATGAAAATGGSDAAGTDRASTAQTFTEDAVVPSPDPARGPVHLVEVPVVPASRPTTEPAPAEPVAGAEPRRMPEPPRDEPGVRARPAAESRTAVAELPPSGPGSIQVVSRPSGARVVLDGRIVGQTPLVLAEVGAGRHTVRLELPGFQRWATSIEVTPGNRTRVAASLEQ